MAALLMLRRVCSTVFSMKVFEGILDFFYVLTFACVGGIVNRMHGSDGGMLIGTAFAGTCTDCFGYWADHFYDKAVMGLPMGAMLALLTRKTLISTIAGAIMYASIFIGWGCYMGMGYAPDVDSRSGVFDWLIGRELEGWGFSRRWARMCAGMGLRGLAWTFPAGYYLFGHGYGWQFALAGGVMPLVYTIGFHDPGAPHAPDFVRPDPKFEWALDPGVPASEFLWGTWLWLCMACVVFAQPAVQPCRSRLFWFEIIAGVIEFIFLASCIYYATVVQHDTKNLYQTLWGLVIPTVALLWFQIREVRRWQAGISRIQSGQRLVTYDTINSDEMAQEEVSAEDGPIIQDEGDDDSTDSTQSLEPAIFARFPVLRTLWRLHCPQPYGALLNIVGIISLGATLLVLTLALVTLFWNWDTPRYCTWEQSPGCMQKQQWRFG